ncbi:MAG: methionine aminotransferase [Thermodesulfobacteriota bacterium]|nr:methionine aminotransferase [Thermodesulfobacteriota bacterium]
MEREKKVCSALAPFGTTIFTEMTTLSNKEGAINLSQGFPDFDGPLEIRKAASKAIMRGPNQYCPSIGLPLLRSAVADKMKRFYDVNVVDPDTQITVTAGASEGLAATLLGLLEPGDEVILIEPCYDLYPAMIARAGAHAVYVSLARPAFALPKEELKTVIGKKTRAILINNPQNPCGKVFSSEELDWLGRLCNEQDVLLISDEVYEHLVYDGRSHVTLLSFPQFADRVIVISSTAKTFSMTGWKVGYVIASEILSEAVRMSHQFITFCTPGALQEAMAFAMNMDDNYYHTLLKEYSTKRDIFCNALSDIGFDVLWPEGTYYASIDIGAFDFFDDLSFCRYLVSHVGVAAIPASFFWNERREGRDLVRFCFCKKDETLKEAIRRLKNWKK